MSNDCSSTILEFTQYVNKKIKHYKKLFSLYYTNYRTDCTQTKVNDKTLFSNYIKILININLYEKDTLDKCNINALTSNLVVYDKIFDNLLCINNLESCDKYVILKSIYYVRSLLKIIKKDKNISVTLDHSSSNKIKFTDYKTSTDSCYDNKCNDTSSSASCSNKCEFTSSSNVPNISKKCKVKKNHKKKYITDSNENPHVKYSSSNRHYHVQRNNHNVLFNEIKGDCVNIERSIKHLRSIFQLFNMLKTLMVGLQKEYFHKINIYSLYNIKNLIAQSDVEFNEKLLDTTMSQFDSVVKTDSGVIFSNKRGKQKIKVFLHDGTYYPLCEIDNFRVRKTIHEYCNFLIFDIGCYEYRIQYLKTDFDNENTLKILRFNFENVLKILQTIDANQNTIKYWLTTLRKIINYNNK